MKPIRDSIIWVIMSTFSHIYIDWYLVIAQVEDVLLVVNFSMWFFFIEILYGIFCGGETGCPIIGIFFLRETDNNLIVYLIEEN